MESSSRRTSSRLKRKRGGAEEDSQDGSGESSTKLSRTDSKAGSCKWEWHDDSGWTAFDSTANRAIEKAFKQKKAELEIKISSSKQKFKIHFATMSQSNVTTGWKRDIRCTSGDSSTSMPSPGTWEWKDEHGKWNSYASDVRRLLDACVLCGVEEWEIAACGREYRVELKAEPQSWVQVNVETGVKRDVRCASSATTGGGDASASGSTASGDDDVVSTKTKGASANAKSKKRGPKVKEEKVEPSTSSVNAKSKKGGAKVKEEKVEPSTSGGDKKKEVKSEGASAKVEDSDVRVVVTQKGKVPVDSECTEKVGKAQVWSEGREHWDATLNQTNVNNNNNKFYILQLLKDNSVNKYSVWFRWGRVGKPGQHSLFNCGTDLEEAKQIFSKKFLDKTCNSWDNRDSFVKHEGKYDLLAMDYDAKEESDEGEDGDSKDVDGNSAETAPLKSSLDERLQSLIELVCDIQAMEDTVVEMKYDAKKAPLGKLTSDQVKSGYAALKKVEECINRGDFGDRLVQACNDFYTRVPHCFGMKRPPLIRTKEDVKEKIALLETLSDIQIAMKVLHEGDKKEHPVDRHYHSLHCGLEAVDKEDEAFGLIEKYVKQTHAKTHSHYRLEVQQVFLVDREGEEVEFKDKGNRQLLWHGSRLSNWVGILSKGLRIAPPEAPVTGYMFGKGIYFADMSSKSANYCFTTKSKSEGLAILCDVSLGTPQELLAANYTADNLPKGKHSTKGLGSVAPDPAQSKSLDGCTVPLGTPISTGVKNPSGYTLNYNEYIVYDPCQVKMKYLVRLKFHYK